MGKAEHAAHIRTRKSYAKRMSDHVAVALVVYTLALIFITSPAMESKGMSILPYFMLVIFVAMVIPACRGLERRWVALEISDLGENALHTRFGVDAAKVWIGAIVIPVLLSVIFRIF